MDDSSEISWILVLARFLHWGACLLLTATLTFQLLHFRPVRADLELAEIVSRRLGQLTIASFIGAVFSGLFWFFAIVSDMSDTTVSEAFNPSVSSIVWEQTQVGAVSHCRVAIAVAVALMLILARRTNSLTLFVSTTILAHALLGSLAFAGHGQVGHGWLRGVHLAADCAHLCLAAIWPTALIPLVLTLLLVPESEHGHAFGVRLVRRFSVSSVVCVILLALTGLINSLFLVGSIHALFAQSYGELLLIKMVLFAILIGCGAVNLLYLSPRLNRTGTLRTLIWVVSAEVVIAMILLSVVSLLGAIQPALSP